MERQRRTPGEDDGYYEEDEYIDEEPMPEGEVEYVDEDYTGDIEVPEDVPAPAEAAAAAAGARTVEEGRVVYQDSAYTVLVYDSAAMLRALAAQR